MAQLADGGTVIRDGVVEAEATDAEGEALDDEKLALAVQLARPWRISISWHTMRCVPVQFALGRFKTAPEKNTEVRAQGGSQAKVSVAREKGCATQATIETLVAIVSNHR